MTQLFLVTGCLALSILCGPAQGVSQMTPSSVTPKPVEPETPPAKGAISIHQPRSPRSPEGDKPINPEQPNLKITAVILVKSRAEIGMPEFPPPTA